MHIHCLGLNHRTANLNLRERLAFTAGDIREALAGLKAGYQPGHTAVDEAVILSTCNRVEIYAVAATPDFRNLELFLAKFQQVTPGSLENHLYRHLDSEAIKHLFQVAAGVDSLVLGEPQILGQVMDAYELALDCGAVGPILEHLFMAAAHAGKRARTETAISQNPATISSMAVRLVEAVIGGLTAARVLVVGAGEMAELAVETLWKRGAWKIIVINRNPQRAQRLAERWGAQTASFEDLEKNLVETDILLSSTGAPHTVIQVPMVERALQARPGRSLVILDIAVPRDVEPAVGKLPGVHLYDMDALQARLGHSLASRRREIPRVEAILEEEQAAFLEYLAAQEVFPVIAALRRQAELIRRAELDKTLRRLPGLSPAERRRLEALTQALVNKLLHTPTTRLRAEAGGPYSVQYTNTLCRLFDLEHHIARNSSPPHGDPHLPNP